MFHIIAVLCFTWMCFVNADYYQMDLTPVIVFSTKTDDDIRPGALKYINLNSGSITVLSFSEEYFITQAAVFSYSSSQGSNVCQKKYQVYLQSSDGLRNLNGYGTQNGVSKYNSLYNNYLCYYNITFIGMNAKFFVLNAYDTISIAYIAVYAFVFRKPDYLDSPNLNGYEISEAFYSSSSIYSLNQIKSMVMNLLSPSMASLISTTPGFESSAVAWFSVKLDRVQLVHQFIVASTDSSIVQNVLLFFRLNDDRDYISYKENNITKVFTSDLNAQWCSYNLMHTFKASEILVYVQSGDLLQFNFRFVEAVQYKFKKPIIGSFSFAETDWFLIKLNETMLITGIAFNNIDWLKKFCVYYEINSEYVPYRDNILFTDDIIFAVTPEVSFFPFRTKNLKLACLKWFGDVTNNLTVNLKGSHYLTADYTWKNGISNQGGSLVEYINAEGIDTLYGDSRNLQKINSLNKLMSNHYGDSCFTQPNLCDTGFTVQIVVSANLTSEDVVSNFRPSFAFYMENSLVDEPQILYFGCVSQENNGQGNGNNGPGNGNNVISIVSSFLFADIMLPSNAEVTGFIFNLNNIQTIGFVARVYVLVSQSDTFRNSFLSLKFMSYASVINKLITSDYVTMLVNGSTNGYSAVSNSLNLKDVLEKVRLKYYGLVRDIGIVIIPNNLCTDNLLVKVNRINIELVMSYKNKVVGNIELLMPLNIINVPQSFKYIGYGIYNTVPAYKKITFSQVYYITTMQIGSKSSSAISVTLNTENSDYFDGSYYTFVDQYYLKSGEIQYVTFKGVLQTKLFYITSSSTDLGVINLEFYGSKDAVCSSPIISAGLSGYPSKIDGYGFHIHLSSSNNIVATVATKDYIYETDLENPTITPYTLTMVWSKQNNTIQLFLNGSLIGNDSILHTNINSTNRGFLNQYLLMYADYYNNQSDLRGSFSSIKIWSASFSSEEVLQLYEQSYYDWNSLDAYPPSGFNFGSDCYCENVLCPCETSDKNSSVEYTSRFSIIKDVAEDDFFDENFFMESPDYFANYSTIYFDNIVLDFQNIKLLYVYIQGNLFLPTSNSCFNLTMQFSNDPNFSAQTQWCDSTSAESIFNTPDLSLLLSDLLKTVSYTIPFTIVVKITNTFLNPGCVMKIDYELPLPGGFIHASAIQENSQDLLAFISLDVTGTCLSYKFKFCGEGFVSLTVLGYTGSVTKELAFFYRRERLNEWVNSYVDLSKNSEKFYLVKFVALKNGLGSGYIAFGTIQFLSSCDELTIKEPADIANNNILSNGSFLFPNPKIFIRGSSELFVNISNAVVSQGSNTNLLQFIDGHNEQVFKKTLSFVEVDLSKDFSFVFWYQSNSFQVLRFTYEKIAVVSSQASALILTFDSVQKVINIDSSVQWHYVVVKYERKFLKLSFDVDFNTGSVFDKVQFPQNSSMEIILENNIFCFQMYNEILFPSALKAAQLCMLKSVENACTKRKSDCEWCNPFYGEWELYPWEYIFDKNSTCLQDLNDFKKTLYQPFNMVVNDSFVAGISNSYEVKISSKVQPVLGFINNGLLTESKNVVVADQDIINYFSNNTYMFSAWVKHTCEVGYEYTPIISTSIVVLLCGITDTNVSFATPTLVFYDNCMYALPGKSGLWYNFAFVYNKTISMYIDGELVPKTECLTTALPFDSSLQVNNVQVSSVGSYATLLDEVFVGDVAPSVLFWRQLIGYYYTENIKQMTNPTQFGFCSNEPWIYDNSLPGTYLYERVVNILQPQIISLLQLLITEFLLAEISSIKKGSSNVCGGFNVYITVQSIDVLQKIASIKNENIQIYPEYYSIFASYKVLRQNRTSVVLSLELLEDERYPISKIYIQWTQKDGSYTYQSWSNTANFILISPLKIFTEYYVCFSFETIRRKLSSCMQQRNTFWTAEGEPVQYPSLSCAANQVKKTMECDVTKISTSSWHGIPYSYNIMYRVKAPEDSCNSLESQFNQSQYNISISYSATLNNPGDIHISFNTSEYHFLQLCIIAYATTQGGNGIGVANYQVVRTQSTAPDIAPNGLIATFNISVITFEWYPLESSVDVWNDYTVPGTYYLTYGILKSSIPVTLGSPSTVVVSGNKYVLKNGSLCHINIAFINAFSVAMGPASFKICFLSSLTKPDCVNPVIKEYYVVDPRTVVFLPESFDPTYFRGVNKSWLFNVQVKEGYNPGQIAAKYLYSPYYFSLSIEKYAERSMPCIDEDLPQFLNQNNIYNITLMGLHPNTSYQVTIQPCNEYGCGKISNSVLFNTYSDIPSCSPEFLQLQNESSTSMIVTWNELDISCANGNIENYSLKCNGNQSGLLGNITTDLSVELINLHKYEFICCRIAVRNINGTGPYSSEVCAFTDEDVPNDAPISSKIKTTFSSGCISILAPKMVDMNGIVLGIQANITNLTIASSEISLQQQSYSKDYEFVFKADNLYKGFVNICFDQLLPFFVYSVELRYFNSIDYGPSSTYQFVTEEYFPEAPSLILFSSDNVRIITINWSSVPIEKSNGIISQYIICRKQVLDKNVFGEEICFNYTNILFLNFNLTNLDRGSTHNVSVAACNKAGCGKKIYILASAMGFTDGHWLDWSNWGACSQTCDQGQKMRTRVCTPHTVGGYDCFESNTSFEICQVTKCSGFVLGSEGEKNCSAVCAKDNYLCSSFYLKPYNDTSIYLDAIMPIKCQTSLTNRVYSSDLDPSFDNSTGVCHGYINIPDEVPCESKSTFNQPNMHRLCNCISPDDYGFTKWAHWSFCSETCGNTSVQVRKRNCLGTCTGNSKETRSCYVPLCPVDGEWGSWGNYSECNTTCGYGYLIRTRDCNNPSTVGSGTPCQGVQKDEKPECNAFPCPVDGGFSNWTDWSICSRPCGEGVSISRRYCNNPVPALRGKDCNGSDITIMPCYLQNCTSIQVDLTQRTLETWDWRMYDINSKEAQAFAQRFKESINEYFYNNSINGFNRVEVTRLKAGSVIVYYTLTFDYLYDQMIHFIDGINQAGKITNISIESTQYYSSDYVSCPPPYNISVASYDKNTVMLSWVRDACVNKTDIWLYVYYKDITSANSTWEWRGLDSNKTIGFVPDLITSHKYKAYMLTALSIGNGLPSAVFNFETSPFPPERPPPYAKSYSPDPTEIYIEWTDIPVKYCNGKILGYRIRYKIYTKKEPYQVIEAQFGFNAFTIKNLKPYTLYLVEVYGYNANGDGPVQYSMCKTIEGVPSIPVPNFVVNDMQSISWWSVSWKPIPSEFVNGILLGYRLIYYLSYQSGVEISGEKTKITLDFDIYTRYYKQRDLLNYAIYSVSVAGFTAAGSGPAPEYQAKTCKCPELLFANLYIKNPFTSVDADLNPSGFFLTLLQEMVVKSCGSCQGYSHSKLYFNQSKSGDETIKNSEFDLKNAINNDVDISFPIYGMNGREVAPDSEFSVLVMSPGIAIVVRNENTINQVINKMLIGVLNVWPVLLISYAIASIFGIVIWFTDQFSNPEQFSKGSSLRGPLSGFWFTFVTMTTIGYGDLSPRSVLSRTFAMVWFLTGLILNGIIIAFIVTNLTTLSSSKEYMLYNTKVAALNNSLELKLAITNNAEVSQVRYASILSMLEDLQNKVVDIVYVDTLSLLDYQSVLDEKSLTIISLDSMNTGYGFVLSGSSVVLTIDIDSFIGSKSNEISAFATSFRSRVPSLAVQDSSQIIADIFSETSPAFQSSLIYLGIMIILFIVCAFTFEFIMRRKKKKVGVDAIFKQQLFELKQYISDFRNDFAKVTDQMVCQHDEERVLLADLKRFYKNKVKRIGVFETERLAAMNDKYRFNPVIFKQFK